MKDIRQLARKAMQIATLPISTLLEGKRRLKTIVITKPAARIRVEEAGPMKNGLEPLMDIAWLE